MQEFKIYFDEVLDRKSLSNIELELLTKAEEILKMHYLKKKTTSFLNLVIIY